MGAIIGKGGEVISQLKSVIGVKIRISDRDDFVPGTRNRKVTISGAADAVQIAQVLPTHPLQRLSVPCLAIARMRLLIVSVEVMLPFRCTGLFALLCLLCKKLFGGTWACCCCLAPSLVIAKNSDAFKLKGTTMPASDDPSRKACLVALLQVLIHQKINQAAAM